MAQGGPWTPFSAFNLPSGLGIAAEELVVVLLGATV
jgi:hypothetical protein